LAQGQRRPALSEEVMTRNKDPGDHKSPHSSADEPIPLMQRLLDNPFLLLFLGIMVPAVFYIIWGVMEITQIPLAD
jgi:hypothetical protein